MSLRSRFNTVLSRTTGYQLVRGDAVPTVRAQQAQSVADELAVATKTAQAARAELEKTVAAAKSTKEAASPKPAKAKSRYPDDFDAETIEVIDKARPYTMTSPDKLHALIAATRYVHTQHSRCRPGVRRLAGRFDARGCPHARLPRRSQPGALPVRHL